MRRAKVAIFSPSLAAVSGVSTHANQLFGSALSRDFELLHFQVGSEGRNESRFARLLRIAVSPLMLAGFIVLRRPDIVHLNTSMDRRAYWRDAAYLCIAKLLRVRVVNQVHGGVMPDRLFPGHAVLTWSLRKMLAASDAVSVLSTVELSAYSTFCPDALVLRIPNAIDTAGLTVTPKPEHHGEPLRLIYIGRLIREKGLFELIDALAVLAQTGRSLRLDIGGSGAAERELADRVRQYGLDQVVHFHGPVAGAVKARLWQEADVLVFPTHEEGLPYALLEAMAAGTPAITCAVGAIPDVMQHEVHGLFVALRNPEALAAAIARLDEDRAMLGRMAVACRTEVLENFSIDRLARDFNALYNAVIDPAP